MNSFLGLYSSSPVDDAKLLMLKQAFAIPASQNDHDDAELLMLKQAFAIPASQNDMPTRRANFSD